MKSARFNPGDYPWILPGFNYSWVFLVPGDWDPGHPFPVKKDIWLESEFAETFHWLKENLSGDFYVEQNSSDGVITPVEVHLRGLKGARRFALTWT